MPGLCVDPEITCHPRSNHGSAWPDCDSFLPVAVKRVLGIHVGVEESAFRLGAPSGREEGVQAGAGQAGNHYEGIK